MSKGEVCLYCMDSETKRKYKEWGRECVLKSLGYEENCRYYYKYELDSILGIPKKKRRKHERKT